MTEEKIKLAIFDFDGTLSKGHFWIGIAKHHQKQKVRRLFIYKYMLAHMPLLIAAKMGLYKKDKNRIEWGEDLPGFFKGFTVQDAQKAFAWITDNYFRPLIRQDVIGVLNEHHKQGHKIVLLSGTFVDFLEVFGQRVGVDYVVGTHLEMTNGSYSGRIIQPLCFGENKAKYLAEFIKERHLEVDFSQSSAYADSIYDSSIFRMVGHPVAVYPDKELLTLAQKQNWEIIGNSE
jgi:HAD superfamily hydrolase (TIGR01490 family)